ncbi:MAG: SulP family inorganic anion transporter [Planctomycetaceae bacterium]
MNDDGGHARRPMPPEASGSRWSQLRPNLLSGFWVFLIALPLCLAIAKASQFPPIAGIWTAVIGGIITTFISNSELTIKGPAAGLIVIVAGAVGSLGHEFVPELTKSELAAMQAEGLSPEQISAQVEQRQKQQLSEGYRLALGVGVAAGLIQVGFGLLKAGRLANFFPLTAVHGMLASIGIIIISKQVYAVFGLDAPKNAKPLELLAGLPAALSGLNPAITLIGVTSLVILFGMPLLPFRWMRRIPAQLVVLLVTIPLAALLDLGHDHQYQLGATSADGTGQYQVGPRFLVSIPPVLKNPAEAFAFPDFRGLTSRTGWLYVMMFSVIATLESALSAKAIELIDPWRRKTDHNREILACGIANTLCALVGALPMISEIVRSKANVDTGATNRLSNLVHGVLLLTFVLLAPNLIQRIPLAALGAMLVYTGFRLAHPREFLSTWRVGADQLAVFVTTIVATLATDLLLGIAIGMALKLVLHVWYAGTLQGMFRHDVEIAESPDGSAVVRVHGPAVFSNWLGLEKVLSSFEPSQQITLDLQDAHLIDHSTMQRLVELETESAAAGRVFQIRGLDSHRAASAHPAATRHLPRAPWAGRTR